MNDLPGNVIGIEASGWVTRDDYERTIIPEIERRLLEFKKLGFLYFMAEDFRLTPGAAWDDFKIGMKHLSAWKKCAVVTDSRAIGDLTKFIGFLIPCEVRVFSRKDLALAKEWIS